MRLEYLQLEGFRRFHDPVTLKLSGKLVAIVGSNEAGKSSILRALSYFTDNSRISPTDHTYNFETRPKLTLGFFLDDDDRAAAALNQPTWLILEKSAAGTIEHSIEPVPPRDRTLRDSVARSLEKLSGSRSAQLALASAGVSFDGDQVTSCILLLSGGTEEFDEREIEKLETLSGSLSGSESIEAPKYLASLRSEIDGLVEFEQEHDPVDFAISALENRVPPILFFGPEDRNLGLPYPIAAYRPSDPAQRQAPSKPLAEIFRLSELNVAALASADASGNGAVRTGLINEANEKLRALSKGIWSQSDACLYFDLDGGNLDLLVEHREGFETRDRYNNLTDRSDGYRQFVALQVFAFLREKSGTILLIDEIDQHLHYDAQADLVQLLQSDATIDKVIYTTHSAGALPEDLGSGVRMIRWNEGKPKFSEVVNKFWAGKDKDGFKPLLFGMGATTLAFFPTRRALIGEGITEVLLLPRLMREASGGETLGFQIIGGLANINPKGLPMLDADSNGVAYFVDGDDGGRDLAKSLGEAGVTKGNIFSVRSLKGAVTIEDLIDSAAWKRAVVGVMERLPEAERAPLKTEHFPSKDRVKALPEVLKTRKIDVAYALLDIVADNPEAALLADSKRASLAEMHGAIRLSLGLD